MTRDTGRTNEKIKGSPRNPCLLRVLSDKFLTAKAMPTAPLSILSLCCIFINLCEI